MEMGKIRQKAEELFVKYNLEDWEFDFDNAKRRFGRCNFSRKEITMSRELTLLNNEEECIDTILHEIAHVIVGPGNGHNSNWKRKAIEIGCNGRRNHEAITPKGKYQYICPKCETITRQFRISKKSAGCYYCCTKYNNGKYDVKYRLRLMDLEKNQLDEPSAIMEE